MKRADKNTQKEKILSRLMHFPNSSISKNFFLKELIRDGMIKESGKGKYCLTEQGKKEALFFDGETGKRNKQPLVCLIIAPVNEKGEFLAHHRLKEPFYDFFGFMGGKMKFGETLLECAARELKEETGLQADLKIAALYNFLTFDEKEIAYHHLQFLIKAENCSGKLLEKSREGHFEWLPKEKILEKKKLFVDLPHLIETLEQGRFKIIECERQMRNGVFTGMKIMKEIVV